MKANVTSLLGKVEGAASYGCDTLQKNPVASLALGPLADPITKACALLKSYQAFKGGGTTKKPMMKKKKNKRRRQIK